jgi:hypothetical protein
VTELATADAYLGALGAVYRPAVRGNIEGTISGRGWSRGEHPSQPREPSHLKVTYKLGARHEPIVVDVRKDKSPPQLADFGPLHHVVWEAIQHRRQRRSLRYPINLRIERVPATVVFDGEPVAFEVVRCDRSTAAFGQVVMRDRSAAPEDLTSH